jgi:formate-dependent nitrite reductase cytochrome c552 subunit
VPQTVPEIIAKKIEAEVKRLAPLAVIRIDFSNYKNDGVDIYIYAPRKVADMLRGRLKATLDAELKKANGIRARLLMEDIENMTAEAKKKYGIPVA